jgi:hypothetical protein
MTEFLLSIILLGTPVFANYGTGTDSTSSTNQRRTTDSVETQQGSSYGNNDQRGTTSQGNNTRQLGNTQTTSAPGTGTVTADQQSNAKVDVEISRRIREELMANKNLSTYAQNVKIVTVGGKVTLVGQVRTQQEANTIVSSASSVAGAANVVNQLTVTP